MMDKPSRDGESRPAVPRTRLRYIPDNVPGYTRVKRGRGVYYADPENNRITDEKKLDRFRALAIPPAWREVWICPSKKGHLQATGVDEEGRKQYLYHPAWTAERQRKKMQRMVVFGEALPRIRRRMTRDLRYHTPVREKAIAIALRVMEETLIRVGSDQYLRRYSSHGLTTLKKKHINISDNTITCCFLGKKKVYHEIRFQHSRLAAWLMEMQQLAGPFFFQYVDEAGKPCRLRARDINSYLQRNSTVAFSSKDYRTWYAGLWTFRLLAGYPEYTDDKTCKTNIIEVLDAVSERLGNTRSVCRQYYVPDNLLAAYEDGTLLPYLFRSRQRRRLPTLKQAETHLLAFLRNRIGKNK
ncbi:DNA topoisomerase IB [Parapedobacter lycopersici]|uniref:DNA topoisomerase IB n=1 Tax=Parapedobacter lycopersici TaxID=1864939 RepID=UPI00333E77E0